MINLCGDKNWFGSYEVPADGGRNKNDYVIVVRARKLFRLSFKYLLSVCSSSLARRLQFFLNHRHPLLSAVFPTPTRYILLVVFLRLDIGCCGTVDMYFVLSPERPRKMPALRMDSRSGAGVPPIVAKFRERRGLSLWRLVSQIGWLSR